MAEKAVLFDVGDTLIRESKDVSAYFFEAIRSSYGLSIDDINLSEYEGQTVQEILIEILKKHGVTKQEVYDKHELFLEELPYAHYNVAGHDKAVLVDGAKDLLNRLSKDNKYVVGAASGQLERILRNLFDRASLNYDSYFKFGCYGDVSEQMSKILESAVGRAHQDYKIERQNMTFITNSKRHMVAAHAVGVNAIGVTTDPFSKKDLEHIEVGHIVKNLGDSVRFIK
jgi:phosphoglycolate phosphatase-like HAD superfamily hydrolase